MTTKPDLKFPLRADGEDVKDADGRLVFWIGSNFPVAFDIAIASELVRLANLAHEAEAVIALALEGMFHANGCAMNPANADKCKCGHRKWDHIGPKNLGLCINVIDEIDVCSCGQFEPLETRCSCGTREVTEKMRAALAAYGADGNQE